MSIRKDDPAQERNSEDLQRTAPDLRLFMNAARKPGTVRTPPVEEKPAPPSFEHDTLIQGKAVRDRSEDEGKPSLRLFVDSVRRRAHDQGGLPPGQQADWQSPEDEDKPSLRLFVKAVRQKSYDPDASPIRQTVDREPPPTSQPTSTQTDTLPTPATEQDKTGSQMPRARDIWETPEDIQAVLARDDSFATAQEETPVTQSPGFFDDPEDIGDIESLLSEADSLFAPETSTSISREASKPDTDESGEDSGERRIEIWEGWGKLSDDELISASADRDEGKQLTSEIELSPDASFTALQTDVADRLSTEHALPFLAEDGLGQIQSATRVSPRPVLPQGSETRHEEVQVEASTPPASGGLLRMVLGSIRNKIILPFLILTVIVAAGGTFVVTRLVVASVQDRLTSQLIETSRSASDAIVNWEGYHIDSLRLLAFTVGIPEALRDHNTGVLTNAMLAVASNQNAYLMVALDNQGTVLTDVREQDEGYEVGLLAGEHLGSWPMVTPVLEGREDEFGDKYAGIVELDEQMLMVTAAPVYDAGGARAGVIAIGTPVDRILLQIKASVLADLTLFQSDGQAEVTTFVLAGPTTLDSLDITPELYDEVLVNSRESTPLRQLAINRRRFQVAYVPLVVRNSELGVVGVAFPSTVITTLIRTNRNGLAVVFTLVTLVVVVAGYAIAKGLSDPIQKLALTARAVSAGDLSQRSGVRTSDEIGVLGKTFDNMTHRLDVQTQALRVAFEEQEREAAFLAATLTSVGDGIVVLQPDGTIERSNLAARDLITRHPAFWQNQFTKLRERLRHDKQTRERIEVQDRWIEIFAAPVINAAGAEIGVVVSLYDVTDHVLEERMRTGFIMQMSHELYTPLTAFKGYADLAMTLLEDQDSQIADFLSRATENAAILNSMIGQMLDVAQMTRRGLQISRGPVDLNQLMQKAVDEHQTLIDANNLEVWNRYGQLEKYNGDEGRLLWAFKHLIKNACTYTLPGGKISVETEGKHNSCVVRIVDTGVGISSRDISRVTEQFYRGNPVASDGTVIDVRGTGLGLFVVERVIQAHGGDFKISSQQGKGTEITITLPHEVAPPSDQQNVPR